MVANSHMPIRSERLGLGSPHRFLVLLPLISRMIRGGADARHALLQWTAPMDIFRILLCVGLVVFLWRFELRGVRPIRDFFLWGVDYPVHFGLTAVLILVIWGVLGSSFGLQGLFLDEDPLTQLLLGATVMLLFAAITVHYVALGSSQRGWWTAVRQVCSVLDGLNQSTEPDRPVQSALANGFLERLSTADLAAIDQAAAWAHTQPDGIHSEASVPPELQRAREQLASQPFRLLFAPAIVLVKGFGLVLLMGVVPALVLPLGGGDLSVIVERLPWLVGACGGGVLAVILGCWTTAWLARAACWERHEQEILSAIRGMPAVPQQAESGMPPSAAIREGSARRPLWLAALGWFFLVHAVVTLLAPEAVTARWIGWPEETLVEPSAGNWRHPAGLLANFPWMPAAVLAGELAVAMLLTAAFRGLRGRAFVAGQIEAWRPLVASALQVALRSLQARWVHQAAWLAAGVLAVASVAVTILLAPETTRSAWAGLRGYASLGAMLFCWLAIFWLATHAAAGAAARTHAEQRAAALALVGLAVLYAVGMPGWLLAPLAVAAVSVSGSRTLAGLWPIQLARGIRVLAAVLLAVVATGSLAAAWGVGLGGVVAAGWLGLAAVSLGSTILARVASRQPALLYPLTVILGYVAFAIPYSSLDERWKSAMPAAGSIACGVALLAAAYTILAVARPRSGLLVTAAVAGLLVLVNGTALFVAPNEFKGTFPGMAGYYRLPVSLDSRDYFRDTTPSTASLRNRAVTDDFDRLAQQGRSERLATVYFAMQPLEQRPDGSQAVVLEVEDPRRRLRAEPGDTIRLAAEEWFTIRLDGEDLIALAEEPFYRRIHRWFRYDSLHMIRHGVIRGPAFRLDFEDTGSAVADTHRPGVMLYRFVEEGELEAEPGQPPVMGLRLAGLADPYQELGADYALIAMSWRGHVTARQEMATDGPNGSGDRYTVAFEIPGQGEPLTKDQLATMASWMERCHLDTLRPAVRASSLADGQPLPLPAGATEGSCLVLEDARTDAAVPVGVFLATAEASGDRPPQVEPAFAPFLPTATSMSRAIQASLQQASPQADTETAVEPTEAEPTETQQLLEPFTLRPAHDRGLFACRAASVFRTPEEPPGERREITAAVYNAGRLRTGDQLTFTFNGRHQTAGGPDLEHGAVFELLGVEDAPPDSALSLPAGSVTVRLRSVGPLPAVMDEVFDAQRPVVGQWQVVGLLNNAEVLLSWRNLVADAWQQRKPKLVIVTVSGGGIRASVWASVVLRKLEATLGADFPYHIRLVTGASGGMVAGSYYVLSLMPPTADVLTGGTADFETLHGTTLDAFVDAMALDQLDAVAGRMLFTDLPGTLSPFARRGDRGRTLEETWIRWTGGEASPLRRPLESFAADERMGWRPSLVYTPMMVEDGRRLLISNLDMAFATRNVGGLLIEPSSRKIERPAIQGGDFDLSIHEEDEVFSLSAVEFFRLFPRAHDFRVTTAIRMSASFPWVSPAVNLPTLPPRRVVDAAYYDNYGVNLSALWLSKMSSWLQENTSGVLVVQIRDKVSQGARTEIDFDRLSGSESLLDRLLWNAGSRVLRPGLQAISTPLIGVSNARDWTMAFRNDEQVDLQDLLFDELRGRDFFRTVVFECPVDVSLSWKLTEREKAILEGGFGRADATPRDELARVRDYLTGADSYAFHKWRIEHRNDPGFQEQLKERYDRELAALGVADTDRLTAAESQSLYENLLKNLKRLALLVDWWEVGRRER
jgi:hypothetical protein